MKTMKYIAYLGLALFGVSCSLDQTPYSEIVDKNYFQNEAEVEAGVLGCYNQMQKVLINEWTVTEMRTDNARVHAINSGTVAELVQMDQNAFLPTNTSMTNYWNDSYTAIYRCNNVLQFIDVVEDEQRAKMFEGELRFLRSMLYFNLVRLWGPIFLMDEPISSEEARYRQRTPVAEVYDFIIEDLKKVIENDLLPERSEQASGDIGRAVMEAAKVTLAKVYMTRFLSSSAEYAEAVRLLSESLVSLGDPQSAGDLVPFADIFDENKELNKEIVFTVRFKSGNLGLGSPFGNYFAPILSGSIIVIGQGNSWNYPTTNVINFFKTEPADIRIPITYAEGYYKNGTWVSETTSAGQARFNTKFIDPGQTVENDGESDWPLIRMGDIILLYAEALNETQQGAEALRYLNIIRSRAGLQPETTTAVYELRQAIRNERRRELAYENHRFHDLVRWGVAVETLNKYIASEGFYSGSPNYPYRPIQDWNLILPLPQQVMNINPSLPQNFGY